MEAIWTTEAFVKILEKQKLLLSAGFELRIVQPMHIISNVIVGRSAIHIFCLLRSFSISSNNSTNQHNKYKTSPSDGFVKPIHTTV